MTAHFVNANVFMLFFNYFLGLCSPFSVKRVLSYIN